MEFFIILLVAVVVFGFKSFVVIPQQEVHVVERLGRFHRALTAGASISSFPLSTASPTVIR